jgi:hypothetical protein
LDISIKRVNPAAVPAQKLQTENLVQEQEAEPETKIGNLQRLGVVFNFNHDAYPGLDTISGEQ